MNHEKTYRHSVLGVLISEYDAWKINDLGRDILNYKLPFRKNIDLTDGDNFLDVLAREKEKFKQGLDHQIERYLNKVVEVYDLGPMRRSFLKKLLTCEPVYSYSLSAIVEAKVSDIYTRGVKFSENESMYIRPSHSKIFELILTQSLIIPHLKEVNVGKDDLVLNNTTELGFRLTKGHYELADDQIGINVTPEGRLVVVIPVINGNNVIFYDADNKGISNRCRYLIEEELRTVLITFPKTEVSKGELLKWIPFTENPSPLREGKVKFVARPPTTD